MASITREKLIEITNLAIAKTDGLDNTAAAAVLYVASQADEVLAGNWWDAEQQCGCVVGTLIKTEPGMDTPLRRLSLVWDELLKDAAGLPFTVSPDKAVVQVIS